MKGYTACLLHINTNDGIIIADDEVIFAPEVLEVDFPKSKER
jgi:hypothetical protein